MKQQPKRLDEENQGLNITEDDVELALSRLFMSVKEEEVAPVWLKEEQMPAAAQREEQTDEAKDALQNQAQVPAQAPAQELAATPVHFNPINEEKSSHKPSSRKRYERRLVSLVSAAAVAGVLMFSSWGQDVMASVMNTFRVQHFQTVAISQSDMDSFRAALQDGTDGTRQLNLKRYGEIEQTGGGQDRVVSGAEAAALAGDRSLKELPVKGNAVIHYMPEQQITFKLHPKAINQMIALLGGKTEFPKSVDGSPIKLVIPGTFVTLSTDDSSSKRLTQLPNPSLDVSEEVDVEQIRQAVLDLPMLPDDMRSKLAGIGDWRHTLPVPSFSTDSTHTTKIEGNEAIVTDSGTSRSIIWLQDDWVYQLSGSVADYPTEESIINEARGMMK
ncbi:hypothetical protein [Paenibacillus sp. OV219]|uniref:hypothetical protein n=1 Tax=Paenibacillus sp. OV219 TaxID=1884377 RepID=UPI0008B83CDF|nr:hypothetical protein [Paenibacillus sp. OV219]SEO50682.1 hypothetical protein SAMN05518847_108110 [Paenibacillus sp. OV219]